MRIQKIDEINIFLYNFLVVILVVCYIFVFIINRIFPDNSLSITAKKVMDFLSFIVPVYISLYIIIAFNEINGRKSCSMSDIRLIRYAGILIFITTFIPPALWGVYNNIVSYARMRQFVP